MESLKESIGIPPFDGRNYTSWKFRLSTQLRDFGLELQLTEEIPDEGTTKEEKRAFASWQKNDVKAMNVIVKCVSDSHLEYIQDRTSSADMMEALDSVFQRKTIGTKRYLKQKLMSMKCPDEKPLAVFFNEYESAVRAYKSAGGKIEDMETIIDLLNAMPQCYEHVVTALETLDEKELTLERIKSRMLEAELKDQSRRMEPTTSPSMSLHTQGQSQRKKKKPLICYNCREPGHKSIKCPKKNKSSSRTPAANTVNQHYALNVHKNFQNQTEFYCLVDSGCSDHIVNDKKLIPDFRQLKENVCIGIAKQGESMELVSLETCKSPHLSMDGRRLDP